MSYGMVLVGGYYRSGTTFVGRQIANVIPPYIIEPDGVGEFPWNDAMRDSFFTPEMPMPRWVGAVRRDNGPTGVCKCTQGALRWKRYIEAFKGHFSLKVIYLIRNPRGIVASHIHRRFPLGFDFDSLNQNLIRTVRRGWPGNDDHEFFAELIDVAERSSDTPLVTVAQWLAHVYDGFSCRESGQPYLIVRYCDLAKHRSAWLRVWGFLGVDAMAVPVERNYWPSYYSEWGGHSGSNRPLHRQGELGCASDGAMRFVHGLLERRPSACVAEILDFAEGRRH